MITAYHTPSRSPRTRRPWRRRVDWPAVAAFTALLLVVVYGVGLFRTLNHNATLVRAAEHSAEENKTLTEQVDLLQERIIKVHKDAQAERVTAAHERTTLLDQQEAMVDALREAGVVRPSDPAILFVTTPTGSDPVPVDCPIPLGGLSCS